MAVDHGFRVATGFGFERFLVSEDKTVAGSAFGWPRLLLSLDQGSDGVCLTNWMRTPVYKNQRLNVECIWDWSHGGWNDYRQMLKKCGLWGFFLVSLIVFNSLHGPWGEARFFVEL